MRRMFLILAIAGLVFAIAAGCTTTKKSVGDPGQLNNPPATEAPPASAPSDLGGDDTSTPPDTEASNAPKPGTNPAVYEDGMKVKAKYLGTRPISDVGAGGNSAKDVDAVVRITITAGPKGIKDLAVTATMTYGSTGIEAESVYDEGIDGIDSTTLPPNRSVTGLFGFAVPKGQAHDLLLAVSPDFDHDQALFEHK